MDLITHGKGALMAGVSSSQFVFARRGEISSYLLRGFISCS